MNDSPTPHMIPNRDELTIRFAGVAYQLRPRFSRSVRDVALLGLAILGEFRTVRAEELIRAALVGVYDGGQMEIAAVLRLNADGRFHYELSYGALDEEGDGQWTVQAGAISLTSDPIKPPVLSLISQAQGPVGVLKITMDFKDPYDQQYFDALIERADGATEDDQLGIDGLSLPIPAGAPPKSVQLTYPVFGLVSDPLNFNVGAGATLTYHFEANDIGKVAFKGTLLRIADGQLILERHGRELKFRGTNG